jgi:hypothetical protein
MTAIVDFRKATLQKKSDTVSGDETYKIPAMSVNCRATRSQNKGDCTNAKCVDFRKATLQKKSIKMAAARTLRIGTIALVLRSRGYVSSSIIQSVNWLAY